MSSPTYQDLLQAIKPVPADIAVQVLAGALSEALFEIKTDRRHFPIEYGLHLVRRHTDELAQKEDVA